MPESTADNAPRRRLARPAALTAGIILLGALVVLVPYWLGKPKAIASAPTPRALFEHAEFALPAHQRACMSSITITPTSQIAQFGVHEAVGSTSGSPPIDVLLDAPGYHTVAHLPAAQEGQTELRITPPPHAVIGTVCFLNTGTSTARFDGSREPRGTARAVLTLGGKAATGDIALTFLSTHQNTRLARLGEVFDHASNLTDRLIPPWLIWILAVLGVLVIPIAIVLAFNRALQEDDLAARP
jgi:hypothetical protein